MTDVDELICFESRHSQENRSANADSVTTDDKMSPNVHDEN